MILKIRHKGLRKLWLSQDPSLLNPPWLGRIQRIMNALEVAQEISDMEFPGFRLHPLKGAYREHFAVTVTGNWRIVFRFQGKIATDIDLLDYH